MQTKHICVLIHIWTNGEVGAPLNRFQPSSNLFYWPFQGGASFLGHLSYFCLVLLCLHARLFVLMPCSHLLGKGWPLGSRLWCLIVALSLSHWYPGSGVVLDSVDSWSLPSFLLLYYSDRCTWLCCRWFILRLTVCETGTPVSKMANNVKNVAGNQNTIQLMNLLCKKSDL